MKGLIHKKWLCIPVTVFLVLVLTAGAVFASTLVGPVTQTITQDISDYEYGVITAPDITLPGMKVGEIYNNSANIGTVTVEVGPDGVNKWLHIKLDKDSAALYDVCTVSLTPKGGSSLMLYLGWGGIPDVLEVSTQLKTAGTHTFAQYIGVTAGNTPGIAEVKVTYTLEDTP